MANITKLKNIKKIRNLHDVNIIEVLNRPLPPWPIQPFSQ